MSKIFTREEVIQNKKEAIKSLNQMLEYLINLGFWNLFVDYEYNIFYNKRRKGIFSNIAPGAL